MNVAIMGAGLSGLTCAIMLERNGISPTIFETRSEVGDRFINAEAFLSILSRPITNVIRYLSEEFQLDLKPSSMINKLILHSQRNTATIEEHLGFINLRGRHQLSFEKQLAEQVRSKIIFHSKATYEELTKEYSHVVLATGDASYALKTQNFEKELTVTIKGATVAGKFDRYTLSAWLDQSFAPQGYAYLLPYSTTEAHLAIAFPDKAIQTKQQKDIYWEIFHEKARNDLNQPLPITDQFDIQNYIIGQCKHPRIGNTIYTGNCFGSIMPFLGFGQFASILTGIYAAYDLCGFGNYEEMTKPLRKSYQHSMVLRNLMEKSPNASYDFIVKNLDGYIGKKLFEPSQKNPLKMISYLLRPFI